MNNEISKGSDDIALTIAVPTYNRKNYLAELLPDLVAQCEAANAAGPQVEIVVVDNASTDSTSEYIIGNFSGRLRYFRNNTNIGADANFIECVKNSSGRYVWLFGDDEIINANAITLLLELISGKPSLIIAGSELEDSMRFESYADLLHQVLPVDPIFPVHHTLITANVFPKACFDIEVAVERLHTNYGHMYAIAKHLGQGKGIVLLGKKERIFTIRDVRAEFHWTPINLQGKLLEYCFYLSDVIGIKRLKVDTWLFYRAFRIYKLFHSKKIRRLLDALKLDFTR